MKALLEPLAIALVYYATGKLGLLTAIPPGIATAIWPPSGIALAAVLFLGNRVLPGIWLGSVLVNLDVLSAVPALNAIAGAMGIATGSTLQAYAGGHFLRRLSS